MTTTYSNAVLHATAIPARNFRFRSSSLIVPTMAVQSPRVVTPNPKPKDKAEIFAVWVESGFAQLDRALEAKIAQVSDRALRVYIVLALKARTFGDRAGKVWASRKTLAGIAGKSVDTWDEGIKELVSLGLVEKFEQKDSFGHDKPSECALRPPSRWKFDSRKSPAPAPKPSEKRAADVRHKQKEANKKNGTRHHAPSVDENSQSENESTSSSDSKRLAANLCAAGFSQYKQALAWATDEPEICTVALKKLKASKKEIPSKGGWLRTFITGEIEKKRATPVQEQPTPDAKPAPKPQEDAVKRAQRLARYTRIAETVFARLDARQQAYIRRCMAEEGNTLLKVIAREEGYAFAKEEREGGIQ